MFKIISTMFNDLNAKTDTIVTKIETQTEVTEYDLTNLKMIIMDIQLSPHFKSMKLHYPDRASIKQKMLEASQNLLKEMKSPDEKSEKINSKVFNDYDTTNSRKKRVLSVEKFYNKSRASELSHGNILKSSNSLMFNSKHKQINSSLGSSKGYINKLYEETQTRNSKLKKSNICSPHIDKSQSISSKQTLLESEKFMIKNPNNNSIVEVRNHLFNFEKSPTTIKKTNLVENNKEELVNDNKIEKISNLSLISVTSEQKKQSSRYKINSYSQHQFSLNSYNIQPSKHSINSPHTNSIIKPVETSILREEMDDVGSKEIYVTEFKKETNKIKKKKKSKDKKIKNKKIKTKSSQNFYIVDKKDKKKVINAPIGKFKNHKKNLASPYKKKIIPKKIHKKMTTSRRKTFTPKINDSKKIDIDKSDQMGTIKNQSSYIKKPNNTNPNSNPNQNPRLKRKKQKSIISKWSHNKSLKQNLHSKKTSQTGITSLKSYPKKERFIESNTYSKIQNQTQESKHYFSNSSQDNIEQEEELKIQKILFSGYSKIKSFILNYEEKNSQQLESTFICIS